MHNPCRTWAGLSLRADGRTARLRTEQATDPDRALTTTATRRGRGLYVESRSDELVASGPHKGITEPVVR